MRVVRGDGGPESVCGGGIASGLAGPIRRRNAPDSIVFVLPDGAGDPHVTLAGGDVLSPTVHGNAALVVPREPVVGASWTTPAGIREIARYRDLDARGWTPPRALLPALEPLPPGADTTPRRAARRCSPSTADLPVDPGGERDRRVDGRSRPLHARRHRPVALVELHLTPFDASQRNSASLTQGRLLVGMLHGRMTVGGQH